MGQIQVTPPKDQSYKLDMTPSNNNRELTEEEIEIEEKSLKYPVKEYHRILPLPGTLGFLFRNFEGGNQSVINFLSEAIVNKNGGMATNRLRKVIDLFETMDNYSKRRIDIFDWLCQEEKIPKDEFWGNVQQGMFKYFTSISKTALAVNSSKLVNAVMTNANRKEGYKDRELWAKVIGFDNPVPQVPQVVIDNRKTTNNTINTGASFSDIIRNTEKKIRENEQKQLTEGTTEFVETEKIVEGEFEMVPNNKGEK